MEMRYTIEADELTRIRAELRGFAAFFEWPENYIAGVEDALSAVVAADRKHPLRRPRHESTPRML